MTLGTWTPETPEPDQPKTAVLAAAMSLGDATPFPDAAPPEVTDLQLWMAQPQSAWQGIWRTYTDDQLHALIRFFTQAEQHWPGWHGGDKNPVIWICRELKQRGAFPDTDLTRWIKAHTENRYLPYGNPLA
ncbi:MAG: hypothetical protein ACX931_06170 [Saccharospirillum sp.]